MDTVVSVLIVAVIIVAIILVVKVALSLMWIGRDENRRINRNKNITKRGGKNADREQP